jgi:hypothetical protein
MFYNENYKRKHKHKRVLKNAIYRYILKKKEVSLGQKPERKN